MDWMDWMDEGETRTYCLVSRQVGPLYLIVLESSGESSNSRVIISLPFLLNYCYVIVSRLEAAIAAKAWLSSAMERIRRIPR